ncbi:MAG: hypothetical protein U5J62_03425 [Desulfurivibrio sp.]|nr:hypothetical protein [Desulfurivibrio sp.]
MAATLRQLVERQAEDRWLENGVATVSDRLHGEHDHLSLAHNVLEALVEVLEVRAGAFYLAQDQETLRLLKSYGGDGEIEARTLLPRDQGFIGRAIGQQRVLTVNDLPPDYLKVFCGPGRGCRHLPGGLAGLF